MMRTHPNNPVALERALLQFGRPGVLRQRKMSVLVLCECSGRTAKAFSSHQDIDAYSCDLKPCEDAEWKWHLKMDAFDAVREIQPDFVIAHPVCTALALSGNGTYGDGRGRESERTQGLRDFARFARMSFDVPFVCLENPASVASSRIAKRTQAIQPYEFGENREQAADYCKLTWLWCERLPLLQPSLINWPSNPDRIWKMTPGESRSTDRARTPEGLAHAMADQWACWARRWLPVARRAAEWVRGEMQPVSNLQAVWPWLNGEPVSAAAIPQAELESAAYMLRPVADSGVSWLACGWDRRIQAEISRRRRAAAALDRARRDAALEERQLKLNLT